MAARLTREQIDSLTALVIARLKERGQMTMKAREDAVREAVRSAIADDIDAEDRLDREVERMIEGHAASMSSGQIDQRRMFSMIKQKLARERNLVI